MTRLRITCLAAVMLAACALVPGVAEAQILIVPSCGAQSLTVGKANPVQYMDPTGLLCVSSSGGSGGSVTQGTTPWVDNITQWASGVLAAMANYGTAPSGLVPGVNAFVTNTPAVSQSGNWTSRSVGNAGASFDAPTGAAAPANALNVGHLTNGATGGWLQTPTLCQQHAFLHITTATDTLAVQGVASQTIRVCGAVSNAAGVAAWFLENTASVNANCSSTKVQIAGLQTEAANTRSGFYNPVWGGLANTSGNGLCVNSTGTGGFDIDIFYAQF